jgi:hydrogenase maturation protein HypF
LFDAVAAIIGICIESNYHAEAPLLLENYLTDDINEEYLTTGQEIISFTPMIKEMIVDLGNRTSLHKIVTRFHNTVAKVAFNQVKQASEKHKINHVILGGGSFQNKYLTEKLLLLLRQENIEVCFPKEISCNDGGIALGQLAVAAYK